MAYDVDAAVETVQASRVPPVAHLVVAQSSFEQLPDRDHSVLSGSNCGDQSIAMGAFLGHFPNKSPGGAD